MEQKGGGISVKASRITACLHSCLLLGMLVVLLQFTAERPVSRESSTAMGFSKKAGFRDGAEQLQKHEKFVEWIRKINITE